MSGLDLQISDVGGDRIANCATTTAQIMPSLQNLWEELVFNQLNPFDGAQECKEDDTADSTNLGRLVIVSILLG